MSELSPDYFNRPLAEVDPEIADVLRGELDLFWPNQSVSAW